MSSLNKILVDRYTAGPEKKPKRARDLEFTIPTLRFQNLGGISEIAQVRSSNIILKGFE